ncbi:HRDC domain-containing protein [Microbacterium sp. P5_E9]
MAEYLVIDDVEGLRAAAELLAAGSGPVAVDVERASGFRYSQRAYLVQVFRRGAGGFLFDPPAIGDFTALQAAIGDVEWVLHAASQDLPSLREIGLLPPSIFDTELASRLLGRERVGLGAVVEETLGITLAKAHSASDWSTRPLPQAWLEYAALDVEHLIDVRDVLAADLVEQGKVAFAAEEFEAVRTRLPKPVPADPWRRLSGLHTVRGRRALAVARALWISREDFARAEDVAPGRLVPDRALVAAVLADPATKQDLARVKEFNGRASRSQLDRWWAAFEEGRAATDLPPERGTGGDSLPPPRAWADRNPAADKRLKAARPVVEAHAEQLAMPTENLLTPELLRRVAWSPPEPVTAEGVGQALADLGARPWQIAETAQMIADAFVESVQAVPEALEPPS